MEKKYDIIIIGGGIIGSSIACELLRDGYSGRIAIFEKDNTYKFSSTALCGGGFRATFTTRINMEIGKYSSQIYKDFARDMALDGELADISIMHIGYLFLLTQEKVAAFRDVVAYQRKLGINSHLLAPEEIKSIIPEINIDGIAGAAYSPDDGIVDPYSIMQWYIRHAKRLGASYIYAEVDNVLLNDDKKIAGIQTVNNETYSAPIVINAAGAWSGDLSRKFGADIPMHPLKQQIFHIDTKTPFKKMLPFTSDIAGPLFRHEGSKIFVAYAKNKNNFGYNFTWDRDFFRDEIWPALAERCPLFEEIKLENGWAGLYEYNVIDHNGIVGEYPMIKGYYLATGFSGHGMMQAPAIAKGMSELIRTGCYDTIDLSPLSFERFANKKFIVETAVV